MERSAIILTSESLDGFSEDKGLVKLNGKPLVNHVIDSIKGVAEEIIVVVSAQNQADLYRRVVTPNVEVVINRAEPKSQLNSALAGFEASHGKYAILLPFDAPFVSKDIATLLFELAVNKSAVVPRYTNSEIETLQAVYNTSQTMEAIQMALTSNQTEIGLVVDKMRGVRYVSMLVFEQIDPDLNSFFRVNSPIDLKKASAMKSKKK